MTQEQQYNQYFSSRPTITITMPSAKRIRFVGGTYITNKKDEIEFLDFEVAAGNQMIFVDKNKLTVQESALDPLAAIKKKAVEDYIAAQARAIDPSNDMGNTTKDAIAGLVTSRGVAQVTSTTSTKK